MHPTRNIKRYSNRKLYDCQERCYVTLAKVAAAVKAGEDIKVTNYETGADITEQVLAQVIFEESKTPVSPYSRGLLTKVIRGEVK